MKIYKVILKKGGFFHMPNVSEGSGEILSMVLDGLEAAEYTVLDVQPNDEEPDILKKCMSKYPNRCLLQLTLPLPAHAIGNHPAIYRYCVEALSSGFLCLEHAEEIGGQSGQAVIKFKVEEKYADLVFEDYDVVRKLLSTSS